jgi:hypothetical protein
MQNRTLTAIALASLVAAFGAQANKGADYRHQAPNSDKFTVTGGVNYLRPNQNLNDYLAFWNAATNDSEIYQIDPNYGFGYFLGFGYMINDHFDVQASWIQSYTNGNDEADLQGPGIIMTTSNRLIYNLANASDTLVATAHEKLNYQAADATLGLTYRLGHGLSSRLFTGLRYAQIESKTHIDYTIAGPSNLGGFNGNYQPHYSSSFFGVGPEFGMDLDYRIKGIFGIVGRFAGAFLIGEQKSKGQASFINTLGGGSPVINQTSFAQTNPGQIVPALDAKLGFNLTFPFMHHQDRFVLEAGYQVDYYFDAVDQLQFQGPPFSTEGVHNYTNLGIMGPYVNLSAKF